MMLQPKYENMKSQNNEDWKNFFTTEYLNNLNWADLYEDKNSLFV